MAFFKDFSDATLRCSCDGVSHATSSSLITHPHHSALILQHSSFITHPPSLITHPSSLITHPPALILQHPSLITHPSALRDILHHSSFSTHPHHPSLILHPSHGFLILPPAMNQCPIHAWSLHSIPLSSSYVCSPQRLALILIPYVCSLHGAECVAVV